MVALFLVIGGDYFCAIVGPLSYVKAWDGKVA